MNFEKKPSYLYAKKYPHSTSSCNKIKKKCKPLFDINSVLYYKIPCHCTCAYIYLKKSIELLRHNREDIFHITMIYIRLLYFIIIFFLNRDNDIHIYLMFAHFYYTFDSYTVDDCHVTTPGGTLLIFSVDMCFAPLETNIFAIKSP